MGGRWASSALALAFFGTFFLHAVGATSGCVLGGQFNDWIETFKSLPEDGILFRDVLPSIIARNRPPGFVSTLRRAKYSSSDNKGLYLKQALRSTTRDADLTSLHAQNLPKILCTGMGVVNAVGTGIDEFWKNLTAGKSFTKKVTEFDVSGLPCQVACAIDKEAFQGQSYYKLPRDHRSNDFFTTFAVAASKLALEDSGILSFKMDPERFGVIIGSGIGGIEWMEREHQAYHNKGPTRVSPFLVPAMISNTASGKVAIECQAKGPNYGVVSACATGGHSIGTAMKYLQSGEADVMLCGGTEASFTPLSFAGFNALRAMAQGYNDDPKRASRPFDAKRAGFVMGDGSGVLLLETEEHAIRRGATQIYGEVAGSGATCDAFHITAPCPTGEGLARSIKIALKNANVHKEDIGYVNAHGTSTPLNDKIETAAIKNAFGEDLAKKLLISSTKSMTGHCLAAAGGLEACIALMALKTGIIPPTINYETPDPNCDLNYCPNKAVNVGEKTMKATLSNSLGFGGHNSALVMKRYEG